MSAPQMRRTPLKPGKPLRRRTGLKAKTNTGLKRAATTKASRYTGPTEKMRKAVLSRDEYTCQKCGRDVTGCPYSLQHLLPRGRGGKNTMRNLVTVCGSATTPGMCHDLIENQARRKCTFLGWLVPNDIAPEAWAVRRFDSRWELPGEKEWTSAKPHPLQLEAVA